MKIDIRYFKTPFNEKLCIGDWRYRKMRASIDMRIKNYLKANSNIAEAPNLLRRGHLVEN